MTYAMPELMLRHTQSCTCTFCCTIKDFDTIIMFYLQPITSNHKEKRYFGNISRSEAEAKCCKPGDYPVRYSSNLNQAHVDNESKLFIYDLVLKMFEHYSCLGLRMSFLLIMSGSTIYSFLLLPGHHHLQLERIVLQ